MATLYRGNGKYRDGTLPVNYRDNFITDGKFFLNLNGEKVIEGIREGT
jgi:hypothetical protein